jgi:DNA-binding CsgD family transcriptional regulator
MHVAESSISPLATRALAGMIDRARLRVLRITVLICLLIALSNVVGSLAGFTASGTVTGPATTLAVAWCTLWTMAAVFSRVTARCLQSWRTTAATLAAANAATIALTGGVNSPDLAVCMYVGWVASVVLRARAALVMSLTIGASVVAGYLLAGASITEVLAEPHRQAAVTGALLPVVTGIVGVLLAGVANTIFSRLGETLEGLRAGEDATTPAMAALLAGDEVRALPAPARRYRSDRPLTDAEKAVVALLADGHRPKQIALMRGIAISTVRSQIKAAKRKTGARTIDELIAVSWDVVA